MLAGGFTPVQEAKVRLEWEHSMNDLVGIIRTGAELERAVTVNEVRPAAIAALGEVFGLTFDVLPADDGGGIRAQPVHEKMAAH